MALSIGHIICIRGL